jgi:uncharacterized protein YukE
MSAAARDMMPVLEQLQGTGHALQQTSTRMESTQALVSQSAVSMRGSLEHSEAALGEQRDFIEQSLAGIRSTLAQLGSGLGEDLTRALRSIDDALSQTVGRLRETIVESNETIDRMSEPMRAAESTTLEMRSALERVRSELIGLGEWLGQASEPVRHTLTELEQRSSEMTRALVDFGGHTHAVDKTMDALRGELHEEGRRFRSSISELALHLQQTSEAVQSLGARGVGPSLAVAEENRNEPASNSAPESASPPLSRLAHARAGALSQAVRGNGAAGHSLGPDPYSRLGPDGSGEAREGHAEPAEPLRTAHRTEGLPIAEEPRLSQLLRSRSAGSASEAPEPPVDEVAATSAGTAETAASDEPEPRSKTSRPHRWRFLGRS